MTLLHADTVDTRAEGKKHGPSERIVYTFVCNECEKEFSKPAKPHYVVKERHFCSLDCANKHQRSGKLRALDYADPKNVECGVEKQKQTMLKKYGATGTFASPVLCDRARKTMEERFGTRYPQKLDSTIEKMKNTNVERWGHECTVHSQDLADTIKHSNEIKWGTQWPISAPDVIKKIRQTNRERYGVEVFAKTGIPARAADNPTSKEKRFKSYKKNGTINRSKLERECFGVLCEMFGIDNVEHTVRVNNWTFDIHIKCNDTYVQFDGMYWHGLDRPIDVIKSSSKKIDNIIAQKYDRDRAADEWCSKNNIRLVRITDEEWKNANCKKDLISNKLV